MSLWEPERDGMWSNTQMPNYLTVGKGPMIVADGRPIRALIQPSGATSSKMAIGPEKGLEVV